MKQYDKFDIYFMMSSYNKMNRKSIKQNLKTVGKKHNFKPRHVIHDLQFEINKVRGWYNNTNPVVPTFNDLLLLSMHFNFELEEVIDRKENVAC